MNGIYSSRQIEKSCERDINFMWLLAGNPAPDHNTIDRFRRERLSSCLDEIFTQFVEKLHEWDEISFENLYVDRTKIEANAKNSTKQTAKVAALLSRINAEYGAEFKSTADESVLKKLQNFF